MRKPVKRELYQAQLAILAIIGLQLTIDNDLTLGSKYFIGILEFILVFGIGIVTPLKHDLSTHIRRALSLILIAMVSMANIGSLVLVGDALINGGNVHGPEILTAALAIFMTNLIIFSIWYWEIDSPGLTGYHHHDSQPKFQFPQMDHPSHLTANWEPQYFDYLYVSITNATAFSPTDTMPLTHGAKALMSLQAIVSLLTIALVAARAVNILA